MYKDNTDIPVVLTDIEKQRWLAIHNVDLL